MGLHFDDYPGFKLKITRANKYEHHCTLLPFETLIFSGLPMMI